MYNVLRFFKPTKHEMCFNLENSENFQLPNLDPI